MDRIFDKLKYSIRIEILRTKDERTKKKDMCGLYLNDPAFIKMYAGEQDGFK